MAEEGTAAGDGMDVNAALREVLRPPSPTKPEPSELPRPQPGAKPVSACLRPTGEPMHARLVEALGAERQINLIKVHDSKDLGKCAGLWRADKEGKLQRKWLVTVVW